MVQNDSDRHLLAALHSTRGEATVAMLVGMARTGRSRARVPTRSAFADAAGLCGDFGPISAHVSVAERENNGRTTVRQAKNPRLSRGFRWSQAGSNR